MGVVWVVRFRISVAGRGKGEACGVEHDGVRNSVYKVGAEV